MYIMYVLPTNNVDYQSHILVISARRYEMRNKSAAGDY